MAQLAVLREQTRSAGLGECRHDACILKLLLWCTMPHVRCDGEEAEQGNEE